MWIASLTAYWKGLFKLLLFMPALLLFKAWSGFEQHLVIWIFILSIYYLAGFIFRATWPLTSTMLYGAVSIVMIAGIGFIFFDYSFSGVMQIALGGLLFFRGGYLVVLGWGEPVSPNLYWISLFLYFISSIFFRFYDLTETLVPLINGFGAATLIIVLFSINWYLLSEASLLTSKEKFRPATSLILSNIKLISMVSIFILLVGFSGFFSKIWAWIWDRIRITGQSQQGGSGLGNDSISNEPLAGRSGSNEPALWLQIMDIILQVIGIILLIFVAGAFIYYLVRQILVFSIKIWRRLKKRIFGGGEFSEEESAYAYLEEQKSLWNWKQVTAWSNRLSRTWNRPQRWRDLKSNQERIRYLFRIWLDQLMKDGKFYRKQDTPAEFVQNNHLEEKREFVNLYYRVRYGNYDPTDEEVSLWKNELQE